MPGMRLQQKTAIINCFMDILTVGLFGHRPVTVLPGVLIRCAKMPAKKDITALALAGTEIGQISNGRALDSPDGSTG
jgi:hypothetical protein